MIYPTQSDLGRRVIYKKAWMMKSQWEYGTITNFNSMYVHVVYNEGCGSLSTSPEDLFWETEREDDLTKRDDDI